MKIDLVRDDEVQHEGLEVSQMSFDMSKTAKLFHMLSSTLYSDKISSIIRELSSNAHDSHLKAGNAEECFILTTPTFENPFFGIRDFGVGLTATQAEKTILCYLGSDKDGTDEFIGGWGIGSKSPFAYAMNYEVIVYKDGKFAHFTCWKNEAGIPNKSIISEGDTDEQNGVEIRVPVESNDVLTFQSAVMKYMNWTNYNVKTINNYSTVTPREAVVTRDFGEYKVKVFKDGSGQRKLVYGGFSYNIDECVSDRYDYSSIWLQMKQKLRTGYDIAFVIDTPNLVSFNMNREVLEHTPKSTSFIRKMLQEMFDIATKREKIVHEISNTWLSDVRSAKNFVSLNEIIDNINEEISTNEDKTFDSIFVDTNLPFVYKFNHTISTISQRGVSHIMSHRADLIPIQDQIRIIYSHRAKPPPVDRRAFFQANPKDKVDLYIRAKTRQDCLDQLAVIPDFVGFDLSLLKIVEMPIAKVIRAPRTGAVTEKPTIYCSSRGRRLSYGNSYTYVNCDPKEVKLSFLQEKYNLTHEVIFLNPSKNTLEKSGDYITSFEDYEEMVEDWVDSFKEKYLPGYFNRKLHIEIHEFYQTEALIPEIKTLKDEWYNLSAHMLPNSSNYVGREFEREVFKRSDLSFFKKMRALYKKTKLQHDTLVGLKKFVDIRELNDNIDHPIAETILKFMESKGIKLK